MKVLVTGANGFLGSVVVRSLLNAGERDVRCLVRPGRDEARLQGLRAEFPEAKIEVARGDLTRAEDAAMAVQTVDVVYHLAATMRGAPADLFFNTVVGTKNLLEALANQPLQRFVHVSSFGVYGTSELPRKALIDETTPLERHPERRDVYSHTKIRQERLVREYADEYGFALSIVRPGTVFGPGGPELPGRIGLNVFGVFLRFGGSNPLPLTYVSNCADAVVAVGRHREAAGESYNVVDDDIPTCAEYLRAYRHEVRRIPYLPLGYHASSAFSRAVHWYAVSSKGQLPAVLSPYKAATLWKGGEFDNSKLKRLGWEPVVPMNQALARTFAALKNGGN